MKAFRQHLEDQITLYALRDLPIPTDLYIRARNAGLDPDAIEEAATTNRDED